MEECFKCHVPETKALLFDAILPDGIVKICSKCSSKEDIPIIKATLFPKVERQPTMRERLSKISGINNVEKTSFKLKEKNELKTLVNENYIFKENLKLKEDLIHNFHWVVLRGRRMKHLTQEQLAQEIHEPEIVIRKIETGFSPEKVDIIIKLEKCLNIRLRKKIETEDSMEKLETKFDIKDFDSLTIADLYEMKKKKDEGVLKDKIDISEIEKDEEGFRN